MLSGMLVENRCKILYDGVYAPTATDLLRHPNVPENIKFRHIIYRAPENGKEFHFVTSDFKSSATAITDIYKKRWAVELLFKWLKGHLNIRYLPVKSPNAIRIQLSIAIIVQLLVKLKKIKEGINGTLWEVLRVIVPAEGIYSSLFVSGCLWKPKLKGSLSL